MTSAEVARLPAAVSSRPEAVHGTLGHFKG